MRLQAMRSAWASLFVSNPSSSALRARYTRSRGAVAAGKKYDDYPSMRTNGSPPASVRRDRGWRSAPLRSMRPATYTCIASTAGAGCTVTTSSLRLPAR
jgi:hypothetical protein